MQRSIRIILTLLALAVVISGCQGEKKQEKSPDVTAEKVQQLVDQSKVRFHIMIPESQYLAVKKLISISVNDGVSRYYLNGDMFSRDSVSAIDPSDPLTMPSVRYGLFSPALETVTSGDLEIDIDFTDDKDSVLSNGELTLPLKPDWEWMIMINFTTRQLTGKGCRGCDGFEEIAVPESLKFAEGMRLFIVWGGNSISNPVVY